MRKTVSLLIFTVLFFSGMAQTPKNAKSVDSGKIANEGKILYDQGQYDEAEKKFKQIPIGDTLYNIAQYELALTYYATRRFEESLEISKKILEENDGTLELSNLYNIVGNTLSSLDRYEEAITIYDNALNHFPYSYLLHFNKGIVFMKMKDYANAATCFEEVVFLNALHQNSHFQLGLAYLNMGLSIQGILAINYAVLLNPASQTAIMSLQNLEQLYDAGIDEVYSDAVTPEKYKAEKNRMLKLENIVKANIFRQKDFKPISSVKHPAVYQNQIIFENITPNPKSKDVVNMLYIPYFQSIRSSNKDFDTYSLFIFSGTNLHNDKVSKMAKKKSVQISELLNRSGRFLGGVLTKGIGKENTEEYTFMYDNNLRLSHFGKMIKNQKGEMTYNGNITFLTKFGARESERNYIDGVNTGVNKYYYDNGELYQEVPAENNLFHGTAVMYAQNAYESNKHLKMLELNYNQGVLDGELKRYNISGTLTEHSHYKNGKLNGVFKLFYPQGGNYKSGVLKDGILTDWFYIFHNNGDTLEVDYYAGEEETGHFKSFYPNGTLETEGEITENTVTGVRKSYNADGTLSSIQNFNPIGIRDGFSYEYYPNGTIKMEYLYDNGKLSGELHSYTQEGKKRYTEIYQKGELQEVITYNPDETVKQKFTQNNKTIDFQIHSSYGHLLYSATIKHGKSSWGNHKYYHTNGTVSSEFSELDKLKDGVFKTYYVNGKTHSYQEYSNGVPHGLHITYFMNDSINTEGYYLNGNKYGAWYSYHQNGKIDNFKVYNREGELMRSDSYNYDGSPYIKRRYLHNMLYEATFYNEKGEPFKTDKFNYGNGIRRLYYYNGKTRYEIGMIAGQDTGKIKEFDFQGNVKECAGVVIEDEYNGIYDSYDTKGHLYSTSEYIMGIGYGKCKNYFSNGQVSMEYPLLNGDIHGDFKQYHYNGNILFSAKYEYDKIRDTANYYAIDGSLAYKVLYEEDYAVAYASRDKNGTIGDFTPLEDKTVFTCFYTNGKKSMEVAYEYGLLHGKQLSYYPDGTLYCEKSLYYNNLHGLYKSFYTNGKTRLETEYYFGEEQGVNKLYHENGNIHCEQYFDGGFRHNEMKMYDSNGNPTKYQRYHYGIILEEINY